MRYLSNFLTITALLAAQNVVTKIGWSDLPVAVQSAAKKQKTPRDALQASADKARQLKKEG